ncbi:Dioxygenases related to 2-nitropropane dioxygenase [Rubrobacter radiotolerans]|uniref:Dioxygenases related to 2-nitropropane dioxygenase n=1 Tax=Rubrobacter radiotolerans TaxID=42256 RepID=A0A023X0Z9_RUBRA|nr:nitronate monooxygenase [Rubrobacter radiotolerans]AHY45685.1 Dioxygenases related to 2-nitropropane dioxygenase [Rubrobacter radiotolerans]MDX5893099.1 nitronate monooxygenase [Rubrobacter radiotolerans]SMC03056.1 nitronate monooxygenase [Rubrobacter radiotolerans DSM 5868]
MIRTELTRLLGVRHPVVCAPMAGWSGGLLAGEVSRAGGFGMIGVSSSASVELLAGQAALARERSGGAPFGIGLMTWAVERRPELLDAALAEGPAAVSLSFGDPAPFVGPVREAGAIVFSQVQSGARAEEAARAGVDALVAQGTDAGGHTGSVGTLPLLQRVLPLGEESGIPVLAAGGIGTGSGVAAVLAAGAAGAWIGTRFCATQEALGSEAQKRLLLDRDETGTVHTRVFDLVQGIPWPEEFPGRALTSEFTAGWHGRESELTSDPEAARREFEAAKSDGTFVYAGQAVGLVDDLPPAGELLARLVREAESCLRRSATLVRKTGEEGA